MEAADPTILHLYLYRGCWVEAYGVWQRMGETERGKNTIVRICDVAVMCSGMGLNLNRPCHLSA